MNFNDILVRESHAREGFGGLGRTAWRQRIEKGLITQPIRSGKLRMWPASELQALTNAHIRGYDEHAIRLLVKDLEAQRLKIEPRKVA